MGEKQRNSTVSHVIDLNRMVLEKLIIDKNDSCSTMRLCFQETNLKLYRKVK